MELIKETGSKSWINKSGKKDSKKFGIFLCPNCKKEVEKPLRQGTSAFSCGNKSCRKEIFNANPNNPGNKKREEDCIYNIPFYGSIKERYRFLKSNHKMCNEWNLLRNFVKDTQESYSKIREKHSKVTYELIDSNKELSKDNFKWVPLSRYFEYEDKNEDGKRYIYVITADKHTKIGITNSIKRRMETMQVCNPYKINLILAKKINSAEFIEKKIHKEYAEFNILGEWFILSDKQINDIISSISLLK